MTHRTAGSSPQNHDVMMRILLELEHIIIQIYGHNPLISSPQVKCVAQIPQKNRRCFHPRDIHVMQ
jgi:hypothetical protein